MKHRLLFLQAVLVLAAASDLAAQVADPMGAHEGWSTLRTQYFTVHYPDRYADWTLPVAARLDSIHNAVGALVGNVPRERVTVIVADPYNVTNGFALPLLDLPTMVLWPTPPDPRTGIGEHRGWGELLAVHEFAHLAHLAWPSRNPWDRFLWSLLPANLGPVLRRSPRWMTEGYATYLEGRLTGRGRPHGAWRPAVLRQWALEGRLPTYAQMSQWGAYQGGAMAYLAGSAFIEWLVEQRGEESLNHVWRRMTAVQRRGFADAFSGVYGGPPDELYGHFTVELTREALQAEGLLAAAGLETGEQYQRLSWHTGDPAVSADGTRLAIVLRARGQPSRVVLWHTDEPEDTLVERRREQLLERDPLDVPAIDWRPRPKRALATLPPVAGRGHHDPRFLPDGRRVLVSRVEPLPDGRTRPDLFVWDSQAGSVRRVTRGEGVRQADPSPRGDAAVGVRCVGGVCDLVRVELNGGGLSTVHPGSPDTVFSRPRYAPDGSRIAVAVHTGGRWRIALVDEGGGELSYADPDDGYDRYDVAWSENGAALVVVSQRGGVPNLERIDLATGTTRQLTRTTSAAFAPEPNPADGSIFFLHLRTRGLDVNRLPAGAEPLAEVVDLEPAFPRVAPTRPAVEPDTFPLLPVAAPRPYGIGPRTRRLLPGGSNTAEGASFLLGLHSIDPIGRLSWALQGAAGGAGTWRGAGAQAVWRGSRPALHGGAWWASQRPAAQRGREEVAFPIDRTDYAGAAFWGDGTRYGTHGSFTARLGASAGALERIEPYPSGGRNFFFAEAGTSFRFGHRTLFLPALTAQASAGQTAGRDWQRASVGGRIAFSRGASFLSAMAIHGWVNDAAPVFERFSAGGNVPQFFDPVVFPQRHLLPGLPLGVLSGARLTTVRISAGPRAGLAPYFWAGRTEERDGWYRVVGLERTLAEGPAPLVRMPRAQVNGGIAYPMDDPFRRQLRGHISLEFRP
jgi:hypothetical protein